MTINNIHKCVSVLLSSTPGIKPLKLHGLLRLLMLQNESLHLTYKKKGVNWFSEDLEQELNKMESKGFIKRYYFDKSTYSYQSTAVLPAPVEKDVNLIRNLIVGRYHKCKWSTFRKLEEKAEKKELVPFI